MGAVNPFHHVAITGLHRLDSTLRHLASQGTKKAAKAGLSAALTVVVKAVRQQVNATPGITSDLKREARRAIGKRVRTKRLHVTGKVGFGVGKRKSKVAAATKARAKRIAKGKASGGVGISAANIHWAVLGTSERRTDDTGRATGKMPPLLKGVVQRAAKVSASHAVKRMADKTAEVMQREAMKAKKGR